MADNAYSNPQRVIDNSLKAYQQMSKSSLNIFQNSLESMQKAVVEKREMQQVLYERDKKIELSKEKTLNSLTSTGSGAFDYNMRNFWNGKIDDFYEIKNGMQTGEIDKQDGQRALTKLEQQLGLWKNSQMDILALAKQLVDTNGKYSAMQPNGVSSVTNQGIQEVLTDLANEGNVGMTSDENGDMFLVSLNDDGTIRDLGEGIGPAAVNVKNLIKLQQSQSAIITVPDTKKIDNKIVDGFLNPNNINSAYVTFDNENTPVEKDPEQLNQDVYRMITPQKVSALKDQMYAAGAFKENVKDNKLMLPLWQDVYNKQLTKDYKEVNNNAITQIIAAKKSLINLDDGIDNLEKAFLSKTINSLANTEWGQIPSDWTGTADEWQDIQQEVAQVLMINRSVDNRVAELGLSERKYVKTEKKPKQATGYVRQTYDLRKDDIEIINAAAEEINDNATLLKALNNAARSEAYEIKNGEIYKKGGDKLIYDFGDKKSLKMIIGKAGGISDNVMAYSLLPSNKSK